MNKKLLLYLVYFFSVFGYILYVNPQLFSANKAFSFKVEPKFYLRPTVHWSEAEFSDSKDDIFYRENLTRSGVAIFKSDFTLNKTWSYPDINIGIHTASKASPVVDDTGVYIGSDSNWFYAFNLDGSIRWKFYASDVERGIHSTAVLDKKAVYFGTYKGTFYSFDKMTGQLIWSRRLGHTVGGSPISHEGSLIIPVETGQPNGYLVRIDKATGAVLWISDFLGEQSHSSPAIDLTNNQVVLGANNSKFFAFDLTTGKLNWVKDVLGPVKGTPVIVSDRVYFADWGKAFWSLQLKDGKTIFKKDLHAGSQTSATYLPKSGLLNIADKSGYFYLFDTDGKLILEKKFLLTRMLSSSVGLSGSEERLLITCEDKFLCLVNLKGQIISKVHVGGILTGVAFIYKDTVYSAADQGPLMAFNMKFK